LFGALFGSLLNIGARSNNMDQKQYLIIEWTGLEAPENYIVTEGKLFAMLQQLRFEKDVKFAVYEIGNCILDWS